MTDEEYTTTNTQLALLGNMLEDMPIQSLRERQEHVEAVAPLVDPTAWIKNSKAFAVDCERARVLLTAQKALLRSDNDLKLQRQKGDYTSDYLG